MYNQLKNILKADFVKNVLTMLMGNGIAQLITLVSIPILTRLYTPSEFGQIALYVSIVNVISVLANGRYDMAIVLPKKSSQAFQMMSGVFIVAFLISLVLTTIILVFHSSFSHLFEASIYLKLIWILPVCVFLVATQKTMTYWYTRGRDFRLQASNKILQNAGQNGIRIARDLFQNGHMGLFAGYIIGLFLSWFQLLISIAKNDIWKLKYISISSIKKSLKDYTNFPIFLMPMGILNTISVNILIFILSAISSTTFLGHFERASRVINFPLSVISSSFGGVFYEKMNRTPQSRAKIYLTSYFVNLLIASVILSPIFVWGESIFSFALGSEWSIAGRIAKVILPLTIFSFATECVSTTFSILKKNQLLLIWQIVYLVFSIILFVSLRKIDIFQLLMIYSLGGSIMYMLLAFQGYRYVKNSKS